MSKQYFIMSMVGGGILQYILAIGFGVHVAIVPIIALFFICGDITEASVLFALSLIAVYDGFASEVVGSILLSYIMVILILFGLRRYIGVDTRGYGSLLGSVVLSYLVYELIHYGVVYVFLIVRHADAIGVVFQLSPWSFVWYMIHAIIITTTLIYLLYCRHLTGIHAHFRR